MSVVAKELVTIGSQPNISGERLGNNNSSE